MRIAIFHNLGAGGAKRQLFEQVRALAARGHTLDVFTTDGGEDRTEYLPLAPWCHQARVYGAARGSEGAVTGIAPDRGGGSYKERLKRLAKQSAFAQAAAEWVWARRTTAELDALSTAHADISRDIDAGGYDIAYICQCRRQLAPDVLPNLKATPSLFCCNDTLRAAYEWSAAPEPAYDVTSETPLRRKSRGRYFSPALLRLDAREERRFVANTRTASAVLANSRYTRERLLCVAGVDARVCYPGVDSGFFQPDASVARDRGLVVSVSSLLPSKRHEFILRAVATVPPEARPRVEIIGYESRYGEAGLGPEGRRLCALAGGLGVDLTIRKEVTDEAVRDAYRRAGAVAFAPYLEPLGLVPLEAMACGAPVVAVAEAGVRETVRDGDTGLLTDGEPAAFSAALARVLGSPDLAARLGEAGRTAVARDWTWERSADTLERALAETARQRRPLCGKD